MIDAFNKIKKQKEKKKLQMKHASMDNKWKLFHGLLLLNP